MRLIKIRLWQFIRLLSKFSRLFGLPQFGSYILSQWMPKGLYARAIMIVIAPMLILQSVLLFIFMERHFEQVTYHLSRGVAQNIAAVVALYEAQPERAKEYEDIALQKFGLNMRFTELEPLPPASAKPFFSILDRVLSQEITNAVGKAFWIDTLGRSNFVEIRIQLSDKTLVIVAPRSQTYASNSHIFVIWMVGTALVLIIVAILFLRNQIRPIQTLAKAAEEFGKGNVMEQIKPRGAREVRQATLSFLEMQERIERQIDQRTIMLAGVSHDLRTFLTRIRLQLELLDDQPGIDEMISDADQMKVMLEDYLAFVRGDALEERQRLNLCYQLNKLVTGFKHHNKIEIEVICISQTYVYLRKNAFTRCVNNLLQNAEKYATKLKISAIYHKDYVEIIFEDNGIGLEESQWEEVFKPFYRSDAARNQNLPGSGLGLTITRDIIRGHGGDISISNSEEFGGLKVLMSLPIQ